MRLRGVVLEKVRRKRSLNGNARWALTVRTENGSTHSVRTRTDSSWGFEVEMLHEGDTVEVDVSEGNWVDGVWKVEQ